MLFLTAGGICFYSQIDIEVNKFETYEAALASLREEYSDVVAHIPFNDIEFMILNKEDELRNQYIRFIAISKEDDYIILRKTSQKFSNKSWVDSGEPFSCIFSVDNRNLSVNILRDYDADINATILQLKDGYYLYYTVNNDF